MTTKNKLDKSFGPIGTISGITLFTVGLFLTYFSLSGLFLILIGAFVGFSSTCTLIDYDTRRVKFSNNLFGFLQLGQWVNIEPTMKIGIKKSSKAWRTYSKTNQTLDIASNDFRIILYDSSSKQIMPLKKFNTLDSAKVELELLSNKLELGFV